MKRNYVYIFLYSTLFIITPIIYLQLQLKKDFLNKSKELNYYYLKKENITNETINSIYEIKDLKVELDKKKNIVLDKTGYLKILNETKVDKFSIAFENLNEILLENKIKILTLKYDKDVFILEMILNNKEEINLFKNYNVKMKDVLYKNNKYIISIELREKK